MPTEFPIATFCKDKLRGIKIKAHLLFNHVGEKYLSTWEIQRIIDFSPTNSLSAWSQILCKFQILDSMDNQIDCSMTNMEMKSKKLKSPCLPLDYISIGFLHKTVNLIVRNPWSIEFGIRNFHRVRLQIGEVNYFTYSSY